MSIPKPGEIYKHYKHNPKMGENHHVYQIVEIGFDTEQEIEVVIYKPLYNSEFLHQKHAQVFVRPLKMFTEEVEVNGVIQPRFTKVDHIQE